MLVSPKPVSGDEESFPEPDPPKIVLDEEIPDYQPYALRSVTPSAEWTYHKTIDNAHPDANEQQLMWLMNRARANPTAEGIWLATVDDPNITSARNFLGLILKFYKMNLPDIAPNHRRHSMCGYIMLQKRIRIT